MNLAVKAPPPAVVAAAYDVEFSLLGCLLFDNTRLVDVGPLKAEHFSEGLNGTLFELIERGVAAGKRVDATVANAQLAADPRLAEMGGFRFFYDLIDKAPPGTMAKSLAEQVIETWIRKQSAEVCFKFAAGAFTDTSTPACTSLAALRQAIDSIENTAAPPLYTAMSARDFHAQFCAELEAGALAGHTSGLSTGLKCFDARLRGLRPGWVVIIGGRPGMGKTTLARVTAYNAARRNPDATVLFFALEMSKAELHERAVSEASFLAGDGIPYEEISPDRIQRDQLRLINRLEGDMPANIIVDDRSTLSVDDVRRKIWSLKQKGKEVRAVFVDYLQLMNRPSGDRNRNDAAIIGDMVQELKRIAGEAGVCMVLVSQLSRAVESRENKRPQLSDLRESGALEAAANAVLFPFREAYYVQKEEPDAGTHEHREWEMRLEASFRKLVVHAAKVRSGREGFDHQAVWIEYDHIADPAPEYDRPGYGEHG